MLLFSFVVDNSTWDMYAKKTRKGKTEKTRERCLTLA